MPAIAMYEDLEPIANLRIAQVLERASDESQTKLMASMLDLMSRCQGDPEGRPMITERLNSALETSDHLYRGVCQTWLDLILKRNHGRISQVDMEFVKAKVDTCAKAQTHNLVANIGNPKMVGVGSVDWVTDRCRSRASIVMRQIDRELEIKFREQEAFPPPDLRFRAFILAFGDSWTTKMSGPLTVPFAIAALFLPGYPRLVFAVLSIVSGVYSSYQVWRRARSEAPIKESQELTPAP